MILAVSMSFIDQTIVAIASPTLQRDLHLGATQGQWTVNAYTVALAATFALGGRLADTLGPAPHGAGRSGRLRDRIPAVRRDPGDRRTPRPG